MYKVIIVAGLFFTIYLTYLGVASSTKGIFSSMMNEATRIETAMESLNPMSNNTAPFGKYIEHVNGVRFELVKIPTGAFFMGNDRSPNTEEKPAHQVYVQSFYLGQYEVTREQWNIVANTLPKVNRDLDIQYIGPIFGDVIIEPATPAGFIAWNQAIEFCDRLTRFSGKRHRLPSEAEWEYACRAGTQTEYSFGDQFDRQLANLEFAADYMLPVGKLAYSNAWGLFDMHGNASEWVLDREHSNYIGAPTDGSAWVNGGNQNGRVLRGGRFRAKPVTGRSSSRSFSSVNVWVTGDGLRVAAEITPTIGNGQITATSAASYSYLNLASETIIALFGNNLSDTIQVASNTPLPISLAGASAFIKDSLGNEYAAPLFFVSPNQINLQIPAGIALGPATVYAVNNGNIHSSGSIEITNVSPGLFSADASGKGLAAAVALRVKANGEQVYEPVAQYDAASNKFVPVAIDVSNPAEQVFLLLFGTGFRHNSGLGNVRATVGGAAAEVLFAGAQGDFVGVDQCNLRLPNSLAGRGDVSIELLIDGKAANPVSIRIK